MKKPIELKKEDLPELKGKKVILSIGTHDKEEIVRRIEGVLTEFELASNEPHLPVFAKIQTTKGLLRFDFFEIKHIEIVDEPIEE